MFWGNRPHENLSFNRQTWCSLQYWMTFSTNHHLIVNCWDFVEFKSLSIDSEEIHITKKIHNLSELQDNFYLLWNPSNQWKLAMMTNTRIGKQTPCCESEGSGWHHHQNNVWAFEKTKVANQRYWLWSLPSHKCSLFAFWCLFVDYNLLRIRE